MIEKLKALYISLFSFVETWLKDIVLFGLRFQLANVFFSSGLAKWNGFFVPNPDNYDLFLYEFFCPDPVRPGALLLCDPDTLEYQEGSLMVSMIENAALLAGVMEILLPLLLFVGLFSRFAALGLMGMVAFIQLAVFPEWGHWVNPASWWFALGAALLVIGPGRLSIDKLIGLEKNK
ncbi:DoxX [Marinomonas sp. MED121]|uniref:DoxX family protein n=1 Tax=Marinomonas sp. MED121 TaxID=314277 RepID=UPI000068FD95|nr:DoxX family protein [Marinomonas sp. MED121]EAQ65478.1 DoxX [Marinomonas sp. MED121]